MSHLLLKLLGSYQLNLDGRTTNNIESDKARALLAYLAIEKDRSHTREKLVGLIWPEKDEEHARDSLSQALSHLRRLLGDHSMPEATNDEGTIQQRQPHLLVTPKEIRINPQNDFKTDVDDFLSLTTACKTHNHPQNVICEECLGRYQKAARLYSGDFLEGFYLPKSLAFEEWATIRREQLHIRMIEVLEYLAEAYECRNDLEKSLEYARRIVVLDELGETDHLRVMRLLAMMNRRKDALAEYLQFQQTLALELGVEPGIETKTLYQLLLREDRGAIVGNLPASMLPFIGRTQELDNLWGMLRDPNVRLICILGMGGCGKTRLALELAQKERYQFLDGTYFIALSAFSEGSSLVSAISEALGFIPGSIGVPKKQLLNYLRNKNILFILDSFETVLENAGFLSEILSASGSIKILVTSRVRLNISGEYAFQLSGMQVPLSNNDSELMDYGSVRLFIEGGKRVKQGYLPDNLQMVGEICRMLEGIPLSLLLASTWLDLLSLEEIVVEIRKSLDFLSTTWNDVPERHSSLRATYEYSWDLLNAQEQQVVMKLAVFHNPFAFQAAYQVAEASLQILHALVGKSLLVSRSDKLYQMHDMVRQYSLQKLNRSVEGLEINTRQKHCDYFIQQVAGWSRVFKSPYQSAMLTEADKIVDDALLAWEWAAQCKNFSQLRHAVESLLLYFFLRYRFQEGVHACEIALESIRSAPTNAEQRGLEGWILAWMACFDRLLGNIAPARQLLDISLEKLLHAEAHGQETMLGQALVWREKAWLTDNLQENLDYLVRCAELYHELGESWRNAEVLTFMGEVYNRLGNRVLALEILQQAVAMSQVAGEPRLLARSLSSLAYAHLIYWKWEVGISFMERAASSFRSAGDPGSLAQAEAHLGASLFLIGRFSEAEEFTKTAIQKLNHLGDRFYAVYTTAYLGLGLEQSGQYAQAEITLHKVLESARQDGYRREEMQCLAHLGSLALLHGDANRAQELLKYSVEGFRQMKFAGELAMALGGWSLAQHQLGKDEEALASFDEALHLVVTSHNRISLLMTSAALVVLLADSEKWEQSLTAYTALMTDPLVANSRWFADMIGDRIDKAKLQLSEGERQVADACGREGDVFEVLGQLPDPILSYAEKHQE